MILCNIGLTQGFSSINLTTFRKSFQRFNNSTPAGAKEKAAHHCCFFLFYPHLLIFSQLTSTHNTSPPHTRKFFPDFLHVCPKSPPLPTTFSTHPRVFGYFSACVSPKDPIYPTKLDTPANFSRFSCMTLLLATGWCDYWNCFQRR
jgi:hypothetical protein